MDLEIVNNKKISELQEEFSSKFPFLKIEFFDVPHGSNEPLPKSRMYPHDRKLGSIRSNSAEGKITLTPNETVAAVERKFWEKFGLSVQIFRKSGRLWIETSRTDSWTLQRQNDEGKEFSSDRTIEKEDIDFTDRDKWE